MATTRSSCFRLPGAVPVLLVLLALLVTERASAAPFLLTLEPSRSTVTFELKATGHVVHGTIPVAPGHVRFDTATGQASGLCSLDVRAASTANEGRDRKMHEKVLESATHPVLSFRPERIEGTLAEHGASDLKLHGVVTLAGAEHPLVLPAHVEVEGDHLTGSASFVIPYVEWGLKDPSAFVLRVAKEVSVRVEVSGTLAPAPPTPAAEPRPEGAAAN